MSAFVHPTAVVEPGARLEDNVRVWHFSHVEAGARVGEGTSVGQNCYIGRNVSIGKDCKLQNNVSVYEGVTLEDGVFCGPSCVFTNDLTPRARYPKGSARFVPTRVEEGASIGANATVVCGHTIGRCAMVGAGAVVTRDVPPYALALGAPAQVRGHVCACGRLLRGALACPECGRRYAPQGEGLREV